MARLGRTRLQGGEYATGTSESGADSDRKTNACDSTRWLIDPARPPTSRGARIVLANGHNNTVVAKRLRMSQTTICKWRARFVRHRLDGLYHEPRPGAPRRISDEQIEQVIVRALEETPRGATHWSIRDMAKASGLGRTTVNQIWRAFGLQPSQRHLQTVE